MRNIVVFFDKPGKNGYPLDREDYIDSYRELSEKLEKGGATLFVARTQDSYIESNTFASGWVYQDGELIDVPDAFTVDVIFNKGNLIWDDNATVMNIRDVENLCTDKAKAYAQFPELCPESFTVHSQDELQSAIDNIPSEIIVAKPLDKEGGEGVMIGPRNEIAPQITSFPYMIQEFIDTSAGIPGIVAGYHDLRIACVNGEVTHCVYRTPPKGKLAANVSQGGSLSMVPRAQIPTGAMDMFLKVDAYMAKFPKRIYSVDMGRNIDGRWLMIEMNSKPGLLPARYGNDFAFFQDKVSKLLLDVAGNGL